MSPATAEMMNEGEILAGCRAGDRQAQHALYAATSPRIYRLLLRMSGNPEDAGDLTQQTYLQAFTKITQFDGRSALATWIYRIAVTEGLQWLRRARLKRSAVSLVSDTAARNELPASDLRLDMDAALGRLDPEDRTVLLLRYEAGASYREIAELLSCAEGTVASRLHRCRERLRGILGPGYWVTEETTGSVHPTA